MQGNKKTFFIKNVIENKKVQLIKQKSRTSLIFVLPLHHLIFDVL